MLFKMLKLLTLVTSVIVVSRSVSAEVLTFRYEGQVISVDPRLGENPPFAIGDPFVVIYSFEAATVDSSPTNPARGDYADPVTELDIYVGSYHVSGVGNSHIYVFNDITNHLYDSYMFYIQSTSGAKVGDFSIADLFYPVHLYDGTGTAFDDDSLPTNPPQPHAFTSESLNLQFQRPCSEPFCRPGEFEYAYVQADVQSAILVGEPAAVRVAKLVGQVSDLNLAVGLNNSLNAILSSVLRALENAIQGDDVAAINTLKAFIFAVEAQQGKKIPQAAATQLINSANFIINQLEVHPNRG